MSEVIARPTCPFKHTGTYVPPRFQQGPVTTALNLGPLASLQGSWRGTGFNAIWRPDNPESEPLTNPPDQTKRFLELNLTNESFDFHIIPGVVPNRGLNPQTDLSLYGLHYLQRVSDADLPPFSTAGQALHIEPGLFMNVPASTTPEHHASIVRMASIPHGVTVMMEGKTPSSTPVNGAPHIPNIFPLPEFPPFIPGVPPPPAAPLPTVVAGVATDGDGIQPVDIPMNPPPPPPYPEHLVPEVVLPNDTAGSQSNGPYPATIPQKYVDDPNVVLRDAIAHQHILGHITIHLDSKAVRHEIANIPFLGNMENAFHKPFSANAFVESARATFWIEWVRIPHFPHIPKEPCPEVREIEPYWPEPTYLQLQYSQVVILVFNQVRWPHVTVATLTLSAG
jgi:hypothetical protein